MEDFIAQHLGELLMSMVLGAFAWAFRSWSQGISGATEKIINELKGLTREFHEHRVDVERRVTRVETIVGWVHNDIHKDDNHET